MIEDTSLNQGRILRGINQFIFTESGGYYLSIFDDKEKGYL